MGQLLLDCFEALFIAVCPFLKINGHSRMPLFLFQVDQLGMPNAKSLTNCERVLARKRKRNPWFVFRLTLSRNLRPAGI